MKDCFQIQPYRGIAAEQFSELMDFLLTLPFAFLSHGASSRMFTLRTDWHRAFRAIDVESVVEGIPIRNTIYPFSFAYTRQIQRPVYLHSSPVDYELLPALADHVDQILSQPLRANALYRHIDFHRPEGITTEVWVSDFQKNFEVINQSIWQIR